VDDYTDLLNAVIVFAGCLFVLLFFSWALPVKKVRRGKGEE
jgi:hypothetical protein